MKRTYWSLTIGKLVIHYGFRRHPWPHSEGWIHLRRSRGSNDDYASLWLSLFGKKFLYWGRERGQTDD